MVTLPRGDGNLEPVGADLKAETMVGVLQEAGFALVSSDENQINTPTSRPRQPSAKGHQIDFMAVKRAVHGRAVRHVDSHVSIDGDHDAVTCALTIAGKSRGSQKKTDTRPREVVSEIPAQHTMTQGHFMHLADTFTNPRKGAAYRDPPEKVLYKRAKVSRDKQAWKQAHQARRGARARWETAGLERALDGDWREVGYLRVRESKGWEANFACAMAEKDADPHEAIHTHFRDIFAKGESIEGLVESEVGPSPDITIGELPAAASKSKKGKAVGSDRTSAELLRHLLKNRPLQKLSGSG